MNDAARLPSRERQRVETRERIFEAALAEFRRAGLVGAQIDRIARAAGVVRGTFYFHFPTKEHVLLEVRERHERELVERLRALADQSPALREILQAVVDGILASEDALGDPRLMRDTLAMYVRDPPPPNLADPAFPLLGELTRHFTAAAAAGTVRVDLPPEQLATMFLTSLFGFLASALEAEARRAALDALIDVFLRGVGP